MGLQGPIQDFPKGGVETRDTKCGGGGGGGAARFRPDTTSGRGVWCAVRFRPDMKSGRGGGGGGALQARYKKRGGEVATPNPPPPPPPPWIRLWFDVIAFKDLMRLMRFIRLGAREKICPGPGLALGGPGLSRTKNTAVLVPLPIIMGGSSSASVSSWELITRDRNTFKQRKLHQKL